MTQHASDESAPEVKGRWKNLLAFAFASLVDVTEGNLINTLFPTIRDVMNLSLVNISMLTNVNKVISITLGPLWSMASDRYNRKKILVFVTGIWGFWTITIGLSRNYTQLWILYAIASLGTVASTPIMNSIIADMFPDNERGKAMGAFSALMVVFGVLAIQMIGVFANPREWQYGFYLMGGLSVLSGFIIFRIFHDPGRGASDRIGTGMQDAPEPTAGFKLADLKELVRIPSIPLLFFQKFFYAGQIVWSFGIVYMVDVFGFSNSEAILLYVPLVLGSVTGNVLGGVLGDRFNRLYPHKGRIWLMQINFLFAALMSYLSTQIDWGSKEMFFLPFFLWGISLSFGTGLDRPMIAAVAPPGMRTTVFGLMFSVGDGITSLMFASLAGFLGDRYGLQPVFFWLVTVLMFLRPFFWFLFYKTYPRDVEAVRARIQASLGDSNT
jgi:MFS family permease